MQVRLRHLPTLRRDEYRMTFDLIDSGRGPWDQGDCVGQIDLLDAPGQHASSARGLFKPALELYRLAPGEPPATSDSRLLWHIGEAVHRYVDRIFEGGLLCPCGPRAKDDAPAHGATLTLKARAFRDDDLFLPRGGPPLG